jgi:hypothetical protein
VLVSHRARGRERQSAISHYRPHQVPTLSPTSSFTLAPCLESAYSSISLNCRWYSVSAWSAVHECERRANTLTACERLRGQACVQKLHEEVSTGADDAGQHAVLHTTLDADVDEAARKLRAV